MSHDCDNFTGSMGCLVTMIALLQLGELLQKSISERSWKFSLSSSTFNPGKTSSACPIK